MNQPKCNKNLIMRLKAKRGIQLSETLSLYRNKDDCLVFRPPDFANKQN